MPSTNARVTVWENKFQLLQEYIAEYGRFPKHRESYRDVNIGYWCWWQKRHAESPSFDPERKAKLEAIGLLNQPQRITWEQYMEATQSFIEEHGRLPMRAESHQGLKIGSWCSNQRHLAAKASYPEKRRQRLLEAGIIGPDSNPYKQHRWDYKFQVLQAFIGEFGRLPRQDESYQDVNLGSWVMSQKKTAKKGTLPQEQLQKLQDIGVLGPSRKELFEQQWDETLQLAIQFYEEYGRWPKEYEKFQGVNIGDWCNRQQTAAKNPSYPPERRLKLESAGFLDAIVLRKKQEWERKFNLVEAFVKEFGRLPRRDESYQGENIGIWWISQRQNVKNLPHFPKEYKQKLLSLGMTFSN